MPIFCEMVKIDFNGGEVPLRPDERVYSSYLAKGKWTQGHS